jgi:hypothetical protein
MCVCPYEQHKEEAHDDNGCRYEAQDDGPVVDGCTLPCHYSGSSEAYSSTCRQKKWNNTDLLGLFGDNPQPHIDDHNEAEGGTAKGIRGRLEGLKEIWERSGRQSCGEVMELHLMQTTENRVGRVWWRCVFATLISLRIITATIGVVRDFRIVIVE